MDHSAGHRLLGRNVAQHGLGSARNGTTVCALSTGCWATHAAFVEGPPPAGPGFEAPLVFAMQKPAAKEPDPAAVVALAALRPPADEGGGAAAASSSTAAGGGAASAGAEQGTKRKRDGPSDDDDNESVAREEGGEDAAPLC